MAFQAGTTSRNILVRRAYGFTGELNIKPFTIGNSQTVKQQDILSLTSGKVGQYISSASLTANTITTKAAGYATTSGCLGLADNAITSNSSGQDTSSGFTLTTVPVAIFDDGLELGLQFVSATVGTAQAIASTTFGALTVGSSFGIGRAAIGTGLLLTYMGNLLATTTGEFEVLKLAYSDAQSSSTAYPVVWGKIIAAARQY